FLGVGGEAAGRRRDSFGDLGRRVDVGGGVVVGWSHIVAVHHAQPHERGPRGGWRGGRDYTVIAIVQADGLPPFGAVTAQVLFREETAPVLRGSGHRRAEPSLVDGVRAILGDEAQGVGQIVLHQAFTGGQWDAVRAIDLLRVGGERSVLGAEPGRRLPV